jgi:DNA helicase-2/ATP-dependent DNA helicase PcrA
MYFYAVEYLEGLNESQRDAVTNTEGPVMVIAGAGSGKTRVLTYRIAHLINKGVDPFNILALTFTNKAAKEMKERIGKIIGFDQARKLWMGTFHSVFSRILRKEAEKIGYPTNFTIYDTADAKNLIKAILKEKNLDDKVYKPNAVYGRISQAKNNLISVQAYLNNSTIITDDKASGRPQMGEIYQIYCDRCFRAGAMDFDDLLYKTNILLRDYPDLLHKYQHQFKYIMVDEYQDTNYSQYLIVKKLAAVLENICVVGDDAQSIYAFRGANIQNIFNFKTDYPTFQQFKLEQNYRSTQVIVNAANSVIKHNTKQIDKDVWTSNVEGDKIKVVRSNSDNDEGEKTASDIFFTKNNDLVQFLDFAILYRTNAQSRAMEEALRRQNIPYKIYGGQSFYQRKEIKDLISYFRLAANPQDEEALKRIINYPARGIGKTSLEKIMVTANENNCSLWQVVSSPTETQLPITGASFVKINTFVTMMQSFRSMLTTHSAFEVAEHIAKSSGILKDLYADKSPEGVSRYDNIQELLNGIKNFSETIDENNPDEKKLLSDFLIDVALLTDADNEKEEDKNKVALMTIHSAKGLEFPYVYVVGMEENLFPSQLSINSKADLEEERRLFYVAITRAEKRATLSYAVTRFKWGNLTHCEPSRFIEEIDPSFLDLPSESTSRFTQSSNSAAPERFAQKESNGSLKFKQQPTKTYVPPAANLKRINTDETPSTFVPDDVANLKIGQTVEHERFGKGKVIVIEGASPNKKATVFFPEVGQKQLLLKFAKLKVLS